MADPFNITVTPPTLQRASTAPQGAGVGVGGQHSPRPVSPGQQINVNFLNRQPSRESLNSQHSAASSYGQPSPVSAYTPTAFGADTETNYLLLDPGDPLWASMNVGAQQAAANDPSLAFITGNISSLLGMDYDGDMTGMNDAQDGAYETYSTTGAVERSDSFKAPRPPSPSQMANTFVHKLYTMVNEPGHQHLISWTSTGLSFVVSNVVEFSREVLPKHYKHNNFSSFVRQLNMYGFHKVNKSSRSAPSKAENQVWEFSHPKFQRDNPGLLDDIRRKSIDASTAGANAGPEVPSQLQMQMLQLQYQDVISQLNSLQNLLANTVRELVETKKRQDVQGAMMKEMLSFLIKMKQEQGQAQNVQSFVDNFMAANNVDVSGIAAMGSSSMPTTTQPDVATMAAMAAMGNMGAIQMPLSLDFLEQQGGVGQTPRSQTAPANLNMGQFP